MTKDNIASAQISLFSLSTIRRQWAIPENIQPPPPPPWTTPNWNLKISGFPRRSTAVFAGFQSLLIQNLEEFQNFAKI